jgi:hypothetical protein
MQLKIEIFVITSYQLCSAFTYRRQHLIILTDFLLKFLLYHTYRISFFSFKHRKDKFEKEKEEM